MPKVLIVAHTYPYPEHRDGLAKINANLLVANPYFSADLLCVQDVDQPEPPGSAFFKLPRREPQGRAAFAWSYLSSLRPVGALRLAPYVDAFARFIVEHHRRYDVIHLSSAYMALLAQRLPAEVMAKTLLFPIDSVSLFWSRRHAAEQRPARRLLYRMEAWRNRRHERLWYPRFRKAVFVSDIDAGEASRLAPGAHCAAIPNGVDIDYFRPSQPAAAGQAARPSLVFTGDMSYAPNRDAAYFLIDEILPRLDPAHAPHLYLVGQRPCARLQNLAMPNVTVTGFVDDLRPYLAGATAYVSPLRFGSGIKNKVLEAMAMGKVVIGTPVSFEGIACAPGQDCILAGTSAASFAQEIDQVLRQAAQREEMGRRARALVEEHYSWDSIRKAYGRLYEGCAAH